MRIFFLSLIIFQFLTNFALGADIKSERTWQAKKNARITIFGKIERGDYVKFRDLVVKLGKENVYIHTVDLNSPGGDVFEAMKIGKLIRKFMPGTWSPDSIGDIVECPGGVVSYNDNRDPRRKDIPYEKLAEMYDDLKIGPVPGCTCDSACFLIWVGGVHRFGSFLRVHRPYFSKEYFSGLDAGEAKQKYEDMSKIVKNYLVEMNVPNHVIEVMFEHSSQEIYQLEWKTMRSMQVVPFYGEWENALCRDIRSEKEDKEWMSLYELKWESPRQKLAEASEDRMDALSHKYVLREDCIQNKKRESQAKAIHDFNHRNSLSIKA